MNHLTVGGQKHINKTVVHFHFILYYTLNMLFYCVCSNRIALHCTSLQLIALHCIASHRIALWCIASHRITSPRITLQTLHCIALHCIALHCIAFHCIALHCIALHCIALHCIAWIHILSKQFVCFHICSVLISYITENCNFTYADKLDSQTSY